MPITNWPTKERPREKLLHQGPQALSDAELLAILIRTGVPGKTAVDLARDLLNEFKGLRNLLEAPQSLLCKSRGLGPAKYAQMQAILEIGRRQLHQTLQKKHSINNSKEMRNFLVAHLRRHKREVFGCIFLDTRYRLICYEELFYGSISSANVYPREVVKRALHHNAAAVVLAHNHPFWGAGPEHRRSDCHESLDQGTEIDRSAGARSHHRRGDGDNLVCGDEVIVGRPSFPHALNYKKTRACKRESIKPLIKNSS